MKSYIFRVGLSQEADGRWNAAVPSLPACYTWGTTQEEGLGYIQDAAKCCSEDMLAHGEPVPPDVQAFDAPMTSVTL